ncbi:cobalamin biosynthesis protein [Salmonella enterica subsp. enterica]|uniref:Cobalamin biosynthesis protein n=1 Tax=Salmonella enterica I TaxID=59201 RepID=A0A3S4HZ21_SALET|nr:cobalamin biosynthesis protein [Salmonella enterica subsp. enterica]
MAGALGIQLGGPNNYFGERVDKPWIGDAQRDISVDDISRTIRLMWVRFNPGAGAVYCGAVRVIWRGLRTTSNALYPAAPNH